MDGQMEQRTDRATDLWSNRRTDAYTLGRKHVKSSIEFWAIRSSVCSFLASLTSLACSAALIRSLAHPLTHSGALGKEIYIQELNALISYRINPMCDEAMGGRTDPCI